MCGSTNEVHNATAGSDGLREGALSNLAYNSSIFSLTHDSASVRRAHNAGRNHLTNVRDYYASLGHDKAQDLIDQITKMYESGGPPPGRPFPNAPTGMGGPMGGMGGPMGPPMRFGPPMGMGGPPMGGPPPFQQGSPFTPGAPIHFGQGPPPQFQQPPPQFFGGGAPPPMGMAPPPGFRPPPGMAPPPGFFGGASSISSGPNLQPQQQQQQQQQPPMAQPGGAPPAKLVNGMSEDRARMLGLI